MKYIQSRPGLCLVHGDAVAVELEEIRGVSSACPEALERVVVKPVRFRERSPCAPLALLLASLPSASATSGSFFDHLEVAIKEVAHSNLQKVQTLVAALVGCPHNVDINHYLAPYPAVARVLGWDACRRSIASRGGWNR